MGRTTIQVVEFERYVRHRLIGVCLDRRHGAHRRFGPPDRCASSATCSARSYLAVLGTNLVPSRTWLSLSEWSFKLHTFFERFLLSRDRPGHEWRCSRTICRTRRHRQPVDVYRLIGRKPQVSESDRQKPVNVAGDAPPTTSNAKAV